MISRMFNFRLRCVAPEPTPDTSIQAQIRTNLNQSERQFISKKAKDLYG